MIDESFDRAYQAGRADLNRSIADAGHTVAAEIGKSLDALHRLEWSAPWKRPASNPRRA